MAYEIPQELEYKEKIIFGLNFEQLIYVLIFAPIALFIFFKTNLNQTLKVILTTFIVVIAGGFIFLNFKQKIQDFKAWYKYREFKVASLKMKSLIPISQITNKTIELTGGKTNEKKISNTENTTD